MSRRRSLRGRSDPVAVTATKDYPMVRAARAHLEDRLVLVGPRPVDDLDELQLLGLGPQLLGRDPARGGLEVRPVPAAVARRRGGEVVVDPRQRAVEGGP